jgi:tetratricopeptide (TPR) repeat protein
VEDGQFQEAVKTCRLGLLGRPATVDGRIVLGRALLALERFDEVVAEMRVTLEIDPSCVSAYLLQGEALVRKGDPVAACDLFRRAAALAPTNPEIAARLYEAEVHAQEYVSSLRGDTETKNYPYLAKPRGVASTAHDDITVTAKPLQTSVRAFGTPMESDVASGVRLESADDIDILGDSLDDMDETRQRSVSLSPRTNPVQPGTLARTPPVAKKKSITEPLADDAIVEMRSPRAPAPPDAGANASPRAAPNRPPPRSPDASQPPRPPMAPARSLRPSAPLPPPASAAATMLAAPIPTVPNHALPGPAAASNWARPTVLAGPPPQLPSISSGMVAAPPVTPGHAMGAQNAGAFAAYKTAYAGQSPMLPVPALHGAADARAVPASAPSSPLPKTRRPPRSSFAVVTWVLIGVAVIGGGVLAGFQIRDLRLRSQIEAAEKRAADASATDTWVGWKIAKNGLASIAAARRSPQSRSALARAQAVLAYEFGDGGADASATLRQLGADDRTAVARSYMALIAGDAAAAGREAGLAAVQNGPVVDYLRGRALLLSGDATAALGALEKAHRADSRPFHTVALAEVYAALDRWNDSRQALDAGLSKYPGHPALVLSKARLADQLGVHTAASSAEALTQLEEIVTEGTQPIAAQTKGGSRWQVGMALVAKANIQLRRGERDAAIASLGRALDQGIDEQRFAEAVVSSMLAADLPDVAISGAKRGLVAWPQSVALRVVLAQSSFAEGRMDEAIDVLPDALIGKDPAAIAVRSRAKISIGDRDGAKRDLDQISAMASIELTVARSLLNLAFGTAVPQVGGDNPRPDRALVRAVAARMRKDAIKAVGILEPIARGAMGSERYTVRLELARSYRDAANYASARAAYADLSSLANPTVRLETAQLLLEDRDPKGAREHIEALLRDLGDKATGVQLIEAMRMRTLTGAAGLAEALAPRAAAAGAPPWMLQREAARIARRREEFAKATTAIGKALDGSGDDIDTILLASDLVGGAPAPFVTKVTKAVETRLLDVPDRFVAQGKLAIARDDRAKAAEFFDKAAQRFKESPASARRMAQVSFGAGALAAGRAEWVMAKLKLGAAIELDPSLIDAYLYQAAALARTNARKQAVALLKIASQFNPESLTVWEVLQRQATEAGDQQTAAEAAKRAQSVRR